MTTPIFDDAMFAVRHKETKKLLNCQHGGLKLFWEPEEAKAYARQLGDYEHVRYLVTLIEAPTRNRKAEKLLVQKTCAKCRESKSAAFFGKSPRSKDGLKTMCDICFGKAHPLPKPRKVK